MKIEIYDIILLVLFVIFLSIFLYRKRKNLKREGLLFLYKTKWGMNLIDRVGKKYKKTLKFLSYLSIGIGYILMISVIYLVGKVVYIYVAYPQIVRAIKIPPIMPLLPYLPQVFKLDFLPSFYFTYWIIILAVIAVTHEFFHGIFMRRYGIKVKSTGFGFFPFFLPVFLAAFVEQDEKSMNQSKKFHQMAVLSAGTFANILTAILFFVILWLFFSLAFVPSGVVFDDYAYSVVSIGSIYSINNISLENPSYEKLIELTNETGLSIIKTEDRNYLITKDFLKKQEGTDEFVLLYEDAPAIKENLKGIITEINNHKINSLEEFQSELLKYSPGDEITIQTKTDEGIKKYSLELGENPEKEEIAYLGVGFVEKTKKGFFGKIINLISSPKNSNVNYEPKFGAGEFIYNLLWWLVLISFSVALVNMLPVGIFDGGKFFYLTVLAITKDKSKAEKTFKIVTWFFIILLFVLMVFWVMSFL